ncbi:MAG: HEAT repeat domain-containing protein [Chloroflexi bacterium]|nr:HEAT repeat domain-containing protein [Chloroflexota bacterium]
MRKDNEIYTLFRKLKKAKNLQQFEVIKQISQEILDIEESAFIVFIEDNLSSEEDVELSAYIIEMIAKKKVKNTAGLILPLIKSQEPMLRCHVCGILGNCGDKTATEGLIDRLRNDKDANVRVVAAHALGRMGDTRALPDLAWSRDHDFSLDKDGWSVSTIAEKAIKEIGTRDLI